MAAADMFSPLTFAHGPSMNNRFMLAPLTNLQSDPDGRLSDDELNWLTMRARGGFGLTMTCAAHVQAHGQGFPGQLGVFGDEHIDGLTRLAAAIHRADSVAIVQLHHAGMRSPADLIGGQPVCPSDNEKTGARALTLDEVRALERDFIAAAERAKRCGFDGVEVHGAHGYILAQFLSPRINVRDDAYGGSPENRARIVHQILHGIRDACGDDFILGLRLSPERFGLRLQEIVDLSRAVMATGQLDFLDMSLWDYAKEPHEEEHRGKPLRDYFLELDRGSTRLGVAGKIYSAAAARACMEAGFDFLSIGRGAILHHDFPQHVESDEGFEMTALPVTRDYLREQGLGEAFIDYMTTWKGFVEDT